ncbi:hypothetical protein SRB5_70450 [Streptomyces sp. RB5]|uniref:PKD domain-containing protein n=1 Tax=Streptomyces smaragdinus TaxID=2585196 RepID=A0A7K0CV38_9ACTN|nr:PKD domain-containing protein [Streptomyces smaragdinus]MQY16842.1 hypothetical protein [Streptomyces smaragdinus]
MRALKPRTRPRRLRTLAGAVLLAVVGLLLPAGLATQAQAATSDTVVTGEDGEFLAKATFNSGLSYFHEYWRPGPGVNSFQVLDVCGDGWTPHLLWEQGGEQKTATVSDDDCGIFPVPRYHVIKTGYAPAEPEEMDWWLYLENENGDIVGNEMETDWYGTYSYEPEGAYFVHGSVYKDFTVGHRSLTVSVTPTSDAFSTGTEERAKEITEDMWAKMQHRIPLPAEVTADQRDSMYKQLWCHVRWDIFTEFPVVGPEGGGPTWDLEAERENIPWDEIDDVADVQRHQCNWDADGTGHGYIPPTDGGSDTGNLAPMADAGPDRTGTEGKTIQLNGTVWDDGGSPQAEWTYEPLAGVDEGARCVFADAAATRTTLTCDDDGEFRVTLTARDGTNRPVSDSAVVTLQNAAPVLTLGADQDWSVHRAGDTVDLGATFTDPGANDTHNCRVTWDDGSTQEYPAKAGSCGSGHTFDTAGMYTMKVTVTDDDGGSDWAEVMVVVYDPDAGFVTGGGSADPETATDTPATLTAPGKGTAKFTFNPKYLPDDEGPAASGGKVAYRLSSGDFELDGQSVDWLVVTPDGRTAFRGTGTLNGEDGYGFVAYATQEPEALRLVVWEPAASPHPDGNPRYDTGRGSSYDLDNASLTPISRGAIRVHQP